jgi:pre-mRNA-splicing factor SYF1
MQLWKAYLQERRDAVSGLPINHPDIDALNNVYERSLVSMHKMPRIWCDYLAFLTTQKLVTRTRRAFDRALQALPVTQHDRIWVLYLRFITQPKIPVETAVRVYRRYLKLEPAHAEEYITYLKLNGRWGEAARRLADIVNDESFRSLEGKSRHALWLELCDLITKHPDEVAEQGLRVDAILRSGIRRYSDEVGRLWTSLADYYTRRGLFEQARDVYEEALTSVATVRDFSLVFDALTQFEEALIAAKMESLEDGDVEEQEKENDEKANCGDDVAGSTRGDGEDFLLHDDGNDLDLRLARLEALVDRRPELLNSVILRQNPHNVAEWHRRAKLFAKDPARQILCYTEAVRTVSPQKAVGKLFTLWAAFAKLYERHKDLENARVVFEKAAQVRFAYVDDLASVWTEWIEMELRHKNYKKALELTRRATTPPARPRSREDEINLPVQERLYRSARLWGLRVDLEESLGTPESVRAAYTAAMDVKVATVQMVLNFAGYLNENRFFEEAFQAYERGVTLFKYPHVRDIWTAYLKDFVARYGGKKVERTRDLFRQACEEAPPEECRQFFLQYAAYEEKHGLARNAMAVYDSAVKKVPQDQRMAIYDVYLARASEFFGIGKVREIYESAIEAEPPAGLSDEDTRAICVRYAALERRLGEIDRARAILVHASSLSDPRAVPGFWAEWNDFEVKHGNEETFREMLRIKRSVAAAFSQQHFNTAVIDAAVLAAGPPGAASVAAAAGVKRKADNMAALEAALTGQAAGALQPGTRVPGFVSAGVIQQGQDQQPVAGGPDAQAAAPANPEDIELGADDDEEEDAGAGGVETKEVPAAVFGSLADRFKKQKTDA